VAVNTREIAKDYRLAHWAGLMREREESGQSVKIFCKNTGICENSYYYWQRKLREAACSELMKLQGSNTSMAPTGFTEIKLQTQSVMSLSTAMVQNHVCIETGGMRISASCEYPIEKLTALLREVVQPC